MGWENEANTLLIENHGTTEQPRYRLSAYVRTTLPSGATYLEPLPVPDALLRRDFTAIEVVPAPSTQRGPAAGELTLNRMNRG